jgi:hypothetical protein
MHPRTNWLLFLPLFFFFACHKDSNPSTPVIPPPVDTTKTPPALGTMNINFTYARSYGANGSFELVIEEPGGKLLLDTIIPFNVAIKAALKTNASLVDVIYIDTTFNTHFVSLTKSVNPGTWVTATENPYVTPRQYALKNSSTGYLHATHFPDATSNDPTAMDKYSFITGPVLASYSWQRTSPNDYIDITYNYSPAAYNYFIFPLTGLYKLYLPSRLKDTVDFSHLDTAVAITYPRPFPFKPDYDVTTFVGIPDSTNRDRDLNLIGSSFTFYPPAADLLVPRLPVQLYELSYVARNGSDDFTFYSYGKTVPTAAPLINPADLTITSNKIDNAAAKLNGPIPASTISMGWQNSDQSLSLVCEFSPDSASVNPLSAVSGLKAKFLQGKSFTGMNFASIYIERAPGFSYAGWFNYTFDPTKVSSHQLSSVSTYSKSF